MEYGNKMKKTNKLSWLKILRHAKGLSTLCVTSLIRTLITPTNNNNPQWALRPLLLTLAT